MLADEHPSQAGTAGDMAQAEGAEKPAPDGSEVIAFLQPYPGIREKTLTAGPTATHDPTERHRGHPGVNNREGNAVREFRSS